MRVSLTFTDCTPTDVARLLQAAGPLEVTSSGPAGQGQLQPSALPAAPPQTGTAQPSGAPPMQPPAQTAYPSNPPPPAAAQPQPPQPGALTPEHLYESMSKYAQTYKPEGIKAVMAQCGLASGLLPQADQTQLYWIKKFFESMKPPGTDFAAL